MKTAAKPPSSLFINCKLWQPDGVFKEAFGFYGSKINFTGTNREANNKLSEYEKVIDLMGRLVLPAFTDGHVHFVYGSLTLTKIDCTGISTPQELNEKINHYRKLNPHTKWLTGGNLDILKAFKDYSTDDGSIRKFLDSAVSDMPIYLNNYDYHSAIYNSKAIEASLCKTAAEKFSQYEFPISKNGEPAGIVREKAFEILRASVPLPSLEERVNAVDKTINLFHSFGITAVSDITKPADLEVYKTLHEHGKLKVRINSYLPFEDFENYDKYKDLVKSIPKELFEFKGFKAYYDGALGSETGLFTGNYKGKDYNGYKTEMASSGQLLKMAAKIDKTEKQVIIHAIGDKAVTEVLDIADILVKENRSRDRRLRIEHAQHINENDFNRFKELNVIVSAQPLHMKYDINIVKEKLPEIIIKRTHNYKALLDMGVIVNFGTDFPIVEANPFHNISLAVTRKSGGEVFLPEFKIDMHNSIKAYTINNAYASFNEQSTGTIEKGKFADFIIMEDNLFEMPDNEISNAKVHCTYFNGEEVYKMSEI